MRRIKTWAKKKTIINTCKDIKDEYLPCNLQFKQHEPALENGDELNVLLFELLTK